MQALQRVHRSRSIGLPLLQLTSNAPSQPEMRVTRAGVDRHRALLRQPAAGLRQQHADVELVAEQLRRTRRALGAADHQHAAIGAVGDGRHRFGVGQLRQRQQRRDLRRCLLRILRPAARFADVDEADRPLDDARRALGLLVQFEEQPALLRAGDQQVVAALRGALKRAGFAPAQRRMDGLQAGAGLRAERLQQPRAVQGHRLVAVADQRRHGSNFRVHGRTRPNRRSDRTVAPAALPHHR